MPPFRSHREAKPSQIINQHTLPSFAYSNCIGFGRAACGRRTRCSSDVFGFRCGAYRSHQHQYKTNTLAHTSRSAWNRMGGKCRTPIARCCCLCYMRIARASHRDHPINFNIPFDYTRGQRALAMISYSKRVLFFSLYSSFDIRSCIGDAPGIGAGSGL